MAPWFRNESDPCATQPTVNVTMVPEDLESSHQALLYIVCTLLFYSLGITVGIITYLKSEREEIEEDKILDDLLMMRKDPSQAFRSKQVQAVAAHLQLLEEKKRLRETATDECVKSSSSFKLCLEVKSPFSFRSRTSSANLNYDTCSKCTKNHRPRLSSCIDTFRGLPGVGTSWTSFDLSSSKHASRDCSPDSKNDMPLDPNKDNGNVSGIPRLDITCSSTPSSNCNKSIDDFHTPPDSDTSFSSRRGSEVDGNDDEIRFIDTPLITNSNCVETNV